MTKKNKIKGSSSQGYLKSHADWAVYLLGLFPGNTEALQKKNYIYIKYIKPSCILTAVQISVRLHGPHRRTG